MPTQHHDRAADTGQHALYALTSNSPGLGPISVDGPIPTFPLLRKCQVSTLPYVEPVQTRRERMEQSGLQQVFAAARTELAHFLQARGVSPEDAEELLQDLYLKLETTDQGPISEPKAYLYRMANNLAHDRRRSEQSRRLRDGAWLETQVSSLQQPEASWNPEEALQARDYLRRVEAMLDRLPERTSAIFRRYRVDGESQKAIATSLGISLSAVEKHLQRAYRAVLDLRSRLERSTGVPSRKQEEGGPDARS